MRVFISHSRENDGAAYKLSEALLKHSIEPWLDLRELEADAEWNQKVRDAIQGSDAFVFLIGPPGPNDRWQQFEWDQIIWGEYYLDPSKALVPVVIGDAELPGFLRTRRVIQVEASAIDFESLAGKIADAVQKPGENIDPEKLELGRRAREQAMKNLREYTREQEERDAKRAGLRALK
jgi:TIR domain